MLILESNQVKWREKFQRLREMERTLTHTFELGISSAKKLTW